MVRHNVGVTDVSERTPDPGPEQGPDDGDPQTDPDARTAFRDWPAAGRWAVYTVLLLILALAAATTATTAMVRRSFPDTDGTVTLPGLDDAADVRRDQRGIPHVQAATAHDLFYAQGYAQAQDRFFAMDVARHRAAGRLAELLGESAVSADLIARTLGWYRIAEDELPDLAPATQEHLRSFSDGVNAYLRSHSASRLSLEYTVLEVAGLNYKPERWSAVDSLAILKAEGSWRRDAQTEVDRAGLAVDRTPEEVDELYPAGAPAEGDTDAFVVSGELTRSGRPLLADSLVTGPSLPSRWYQVSLSCRPVSIDCPFDVTGATLPGIPGVLVGHTATAAWGLARSRADVADLFLVDLEGKEYRRGRARLPLQLRDELIRIQGEPSRTLTVRSTVDGPLLSDVVGEIATVGANAGAGTDTYAVALAATALAPSHAADALFELDRAVDARTVRAAAARLALPGYDLLYAGAGGGLGKITLGPLPTRASGHTGLDPAPGWEVSVSWVNRTARLPEDTAARAGVLGGNARIRALVAADPGGWTASALGRVQTDTRNPVAPVLVPALLKVPEPSRYYSDGQRLLAAWDYRQPAGSAAAAYFNAVWRNLLELTFGDQLRPRLRPDGGPRWQTFVRRLLREPNSPWWDDVSTEDVVEDRDTILSLAIRRARDELTRDVARDPDRWDWGDLQRMPLPDGPLRPRDLGLLSRLVDRGPYGVGGGAGTASGTTSDLADGYDVVRAPALRFVVDLGNLDDSRWVVLGGASGHAFAEHYRDQLARWRANRSFAWPFSDEAVQRATEDVLGLRRGD